MKSNLPRPSTLPALLAAQSDELVLKVGGIV